MSNAVAHGRPYHIDDLDHFPDDGHRYELIEGTLLVSPSPTNLHQRACHRLQLLLDAACPPELEVLPGPVDVVLSAGTLLIPDVVVARGADVEASRFDRALPLLVVEVISPSSRLIDPNSKRIAYRNGGIGAYLIADPQGPGVRFIRWDGDDEREQYATDDQVLTIDWPVVAEVCPTDLVTTRR